MDLKPNTKWRKQVKEFWAEVHRQYDFELVELEIFRTACDALNRLLSARDTLDKDGLTIYTERGARVHPAHAIEKGARDAFLRYLKSLGISTPKPKHVGRPSQRIGI